MSPAATAAPPVLRAPAGGALRVQARPSFESSSIMSESLASSRLLHCGQSHLLAFISASMWVLFALLTTLHARSKKSPYDASGSWSFPVTAAPSYPSADLPVAEEVPFSVVRSDGDSESEGKGLSGQPAFSSVLTAMAGTVKHPVSLDQSRTSPTITRDETRTTQWPSHSSEMSSSSSPVGDVITLTTSDPTGSPAVTLRPTETPAGQTSSSKSAITEVTPNHSGMGSSEHASNPGDLLTAAGQGSPRGLATINIDFDQGEIAAAAAQLKAMSTQAYPNKSLSLPGSRPESKTGSILSSITRAGTAFFPSESDLPLLPTAAQTTRRITLVRLQIVTFILQSNPKPHHHYE
ncbi:hypothetical protein EYF80_013973 [Liparis tanakae]|uniref:Uncharacterized protein n=1 Tax=Liparis tanakae TaxID=230148 RepID=A0A4Z2ID11_9TELE|nr:hypothetical protein EYF80_013973 [Liparis tanakae]